ncbi:hypothetical protein ALC53_05250 [Atta colombica]|uniref:Uncharacterized protein n=1 Tax=Atta colombica TaxID=520822 RepID=A0A195BJB6_9HYME|nr:hypothetical protein ALC53_05250 [Atta colombica]
MAKALRWRIHLTPLYVVAFNVDFIRRSYRQTSMPKNSQCQPVFHCDTRSSKKRYAYTMLKIEANVITINYLKIDRGILTMLPFLKRYLAMQRKRPYHQLYSLRLVHIVHINGHTNSLRLQILCRLGFTLVVTVVWASVTPDKFPEWAEELRSVRPDGFYFVRDNTRNLKIKIIFLETLFNSSNGHTTVPVRKYVVKEEGRRKGRGGGGRNEGTDVWCVTVTSLRGSPPKRKKARVGSRKRIAPRYGALVQSLIEVPVFLRRRNETVSILSVGTKGGDSHANTDHELQKKVLRLTTVESILAKSFCPGCLDIHSFLVEMNLLHIVSCENKFLLINSAVAHRYWIKCYVEEKTRTALADRRGTWVSEGASGETPGGYQEKRRNGPSPLLVSTGPTAPGELRTRFMANERNPSVLFYVLRKGGGASVGSDDLTGSEPSRSSLLYRRCNIKSDYSHAIDSCHILDYHVSRIFRRIINALLTLHRNGQKFLLTNNELLWNTYQRKILLLGALMIPKTFFERSSSELLPKTVILQFYSNYQLQNYVKNIISRLLIFVLHVDPGKQPVIMASLLGTCSNFQ